MKNVFISLLTVLGLSCAQPTLQPSTQNVVLETKTLHPQHTEGTATCIFNQPQEEFTFKFNQNGHYNLRIEYGLTDDQGNKYDSTQATRLFYELCKNKLSTKIEALPLTRKNGITLYDILKLSTDGKTYT